MHLRQILYWAVCVYTCSKWEIEFLKTLADLQRWVGAEKSKCFIALVKWVILHFYPKTSWDLNGFFEWRKHITDLRIGNPIHIIIILSYNKIIFNAHKSDWIARHIVDNGDFVTTISRIYWRMRRRNNDDTVYTDYRNNGAFFTVCMWWILQNLHSVCNVLL